MSGGSWQYLYSKIEDAAERLADPAQTPLRRAFSEHLALVANALHDIEWTDSHDYGPGDEDESIRSALGKDAEALELKEIIKQAERVLETLRAALGRCGENP